MRPAEGRLALLVRLLLGLDQRRRRRLIVVGLRYRRRGLARFRGAVLHGTERLSAELSLDLEKEFLGVRADLRARARSDELFHLLPVLPEAPDR